MGLIDVAIVIVTLVLMVMVIIAVTLTIMLRRHKKLAGLEFATTNNTTDDMPPAEDEDLGEQQESAKPNNKKWAVWNNWGKKDEQGEAPDEEPDDESDETDNKPEMAYDFDYSGFDDKQEEIEDTRPDELDKPDDIELCMEIERLTDKANKLKDHIEIRMLADNPGLEVPQELLEIEEYNELPAEYAELKQEAERLKDKINRQIDYIEDSGKKQGDIIKKPDNNSNEKPFLVCVANALSNMQQKELVYKPQKQRGNQSYTYVSSAEFFEILSSTIPDYKKKNVLEDLKQHGIIDNVDVGYDTVYNKRRVLKVNSNQFVLLTTEIIQDAGA